MKISGAYGFRFTLMWLELQYKIFFFYCVVRLTEEMEDYDEENKNCLYLRPCNGR